MSCLPANYVFASKSCLQPLTPYTYMCTTLSYPTTPASVYFPLEKVERFLANLDTDSAADPDDFGACVLNTCSAALAHPLSALFTPSVSLGKFLSAWKLANIITIHKHGAKTDPF